MKGFFEAGSVAVVGVSNSPTNLGQAIVFNLLEFHYEGFIYLVGTRGGAFMGHKIYPSVLDIPEPVELAVILVPASVVPKVLHECGEKQITRVVLESGGFRELGRGRLALEEEVVRILDHYKMRMIGPNCIGIINRRNGLAVPFMPLKAEVPLGRVGIVAQSGGVGIMMTNLLAAENIGFSKLVSVGNKLNVDENDLVEYLSHDDETDVISCYLEGISRGRQFMEIAGRSAKPVIVHKSNVGSSGSVIARSHSASLSTDDRVVDAAFRQCGIIRTRDQRESMESIKAFSLPSLAGKRLAIISRSGGHAVMAADAAEEFGFTLPPFREDLIRMVQEHSRAKVIDFHNPMDLGDLFDLPLYRTLAEKSLVNEEIDGLVFIHNYQGVFDAKESRELIVHLGELIPRFGKPIALCVFTTQAELAIDRKAAGFPIFGDPREAVRALALVRLRQRTPRSPFASKRPPGLDRIKARALLENAKTGPIPPEALASVLSCYGIPVVSWETAETEDEAVEAAKRLGFPVVMKTAAPGVIHKSDVGGVHMDLVDESALRKSYRQLLGIGPSVLLQKQAEPGMEWLVGGRQDQNFGPVVVVAVGGIFVEVLRETAIGIAPVGREDADLLVRGCRGSEILDGVRGQNKADRQALVDVMVRASWLMNDLPELQELDLNPVRVFAEGSLALDWRAVKGSCAKLLE